MCLHQGASMVCVEGPTRVTCRTYLGFVETVRAVIGHLGLIAVSVLFVYIE